MTDVILTANAGSSSLKFALYPAALEGLDALVFTAGIGENSPLIRARISEGVAWMGARTDAQANRMGATAFHAPDSDVALLRLDTDEEGVIARSVIRVLERAAVVGSRFEGPDHP